MRTITLNYSELVRLLKAALYVTVAFAALITVGTFWLSSSPATLAEVAFKAFSTGIFLTTLILGFVAKRPWTSDRLSKWLGRPSVHGIWAGELLTDWADAQGNTQPPIHIVFVIRQTFLFLSIQSFTKNQPAHSTFEFLSTDEKTTDTHLTYVFEMRRTAYKENKLTSGYGYLTLLDAGRVLAGDYWTNSPTQGRLRLEFVTKDCDGINSYESASRTITGPKTTA